MTSKADQPFPVDVQKLVGDIEKTFNPLHQGFPLEVRVTEAKQNHVCLSVAIPREMTRPFVALLESMQSLLRVVDRHSRVSMPRPQALDVEALEERKRYESEFRQRICTLFDGFRAEGATIREAVSRTNMTLKEQRHPWANYATVQSLLRSEGRLKR